MSEQLQLTLEQIRAARSEAISAFAESVRRSYVPQVGYWLVRLRKGGPRVPAAIRWIHTTHEPGRPSNKMERSPFLAAFIMDDPVSLDEVVFARKIETISEEEYQYRVALGHWTAEHAPDEPLANPRRPIDLLKAPPPW